jgi:hypothetical protein
MICSRLQDTNLSLTSQGYHGPRACCELKKWAAFAERPGMASSPHDTKTHYKKGQPLYIAGEKADRVFIIQQGLFAVTLPTGQKSIDLFKATQPQILGEEALRGEAVYGATAVAVNDSTVIVMPVKQATTFIDGSGGPLKQLYQGIIAKLAYIHKELVTSKCAAAAGPCPPDRVAKMFTVIHQIATYTGKRKDDVVTVTWLSFKRYCQRVFAESPVRLEQAMYMLANLNIATLEMVPDETDPEAPMDLGFIHFRGLDTVGRFAAHYRQNPRCPKTGEFGPFIEELELWNKNGQPKGMPEPVDPNSKAALKPKKRAS